jgi:hypothetical protein
VARESPIGRLSTLSAHCRGVFRGVEAVEVCVTRKQLAALITAGVIERVLPDTYRMTAVARSNEQSLRAALLWAGDKAAAAGRSAGESYGLEGVTASQPEIVIPRKTSHLRSSVVIIHRPMNMAAQMVRQHRGIRVTGPEPTMVALAAVLESEALEIACEDARRRRLTSVPAMRAYLEKHGRAGRPGVAALRALLQELDPVHASRSTLEVKARRLLVAHGISDFVREFPLEWNGRTYQYDFGFERQSVILDTNGRRWHDDAADYERDNEKWSVSARHGYRIVFATWEKVTKRPKVLLDELDAALGATRLGTG